MGLGVQYHAPLPRRGWLKKPVSVGDLWQQVSDLARKAVERLGRPLTDGFWSHATGDKLWLNVVPFEENIEISLDGDVVQISAKTSSAGPGYHQFVIALIDLLEKEAGLVWRTQSEDEGDETGYRVSRDEHELRMEMSRQLRGIARAVIEALGPGTMLNMSIEGKPQSNAYALSPMGEWSQEWMERMANADKEEAERRAEEYFPWWDAGLTASTLLKFGNTLCWTTVRWVKPATPAEEQVIKTALDCFERARALGAQDLPESEIAELRRLLDPEAVDVPPKPEGIGFRRRDFDNFVSGWCIPLPGYYHEEFEDDGSTHVFWFADRTVRVTTFSVQGSKSAAEILSTVHKDDEQPLTKLADGLCGSAKTTRDETDQTYLTFIHLAAPGALCVLTVAHTREEDREWALAIAATVTSARANQ